MGQDKAIDYEAFPERRCRSFGERQGAGVKRMHVLSYLISCGFQRCVPRIIGRAIRGTLSNGAKIIDVFRAKLDMKITHAVHTQILCGFQSHIPQTVNRRVGKSDRDVPRKLASSIRGTRRSKFIPAGISAPLPRFLRGARSTRRRSAKWPKRGCSGITTARQEEYQDCSHSYPICPFGSQTRSAEERKSRACSSTRAASSAAGSSPMKRTSE